MPSPYPGAAAAPARTRPRPRTEQATSPAEPHNQHTRTAPALRPEPPGTGHRSSPWILWQQRAAHNWSIRAITRPGLVNVYDGEDGRRATPSGTRTSRRVFRAHAFTQLRHAAGTRVCRGRAAHRVVLDPHTTTTGRPCVTQRRVDRAASAPRRRPSHPTQADGGPPTCERTVSRW